MLRNSASSSRQEVQLQQLMSMPRSRKAVKTMRHSQFHLCALWCRLIAHDLLPVQIHWFCQSTGRPQSQRSVPNLLCSCNQPAGPYQTKQVLPARKSVRPAHPPQITLSLPVQLTTMKFNYRWRSQGASGRISYCHQRKCRLTISSQTIFSHNFAHTHCTDFVRVSLLAY